jgi:tRNA pseudouridine55 synthase
LIVVDKPAGWTSHDCVARCRKLLGTRKVGHAGTLDPDATGVLLVGAGSVTRLLRFLGSLPKAYVGEVVLGTATSTLDAAGEVTGTWDMSGVGASAVAASARDLTGEILQVPPMVSAVSVGGHRLHELARAGIEVERAARPVTVHRLDSVPTPDPLVYRLEVECSSGTYVRVLAADLGAALGGGAHLRGLRRVAVGPFTEARAVPLDDVTPDRLLPPLAAVEHLDRVTVDAGAAAMVAHGRVLAADALGVQGDGPWAVTDAGGRLLAVYEDHGDGRAKPAVVLPVA